MTVARWAIVACVVVLGGCRARAPVSPQERCESGRYLESSAACTQLAAAASTDAERSRLELVALRNLLWTCADASAGARCDGVLLGLWANTTDPQEVTTVLSLSQTRCLAGNAAGCQRARDAAWSGRGTAVDGAASYGWNAQCPACGAWAPTEIAPADGGAVLTPDQRLGRASQLASAGGRLEAMGILRAELAAGLYAGNDLAARAQVLAGSAQLWSAEVAPYITAEPLRALVAAEALVARAPAEPELAGRLAQLRASVVAPALARLEQARLAALPLATWFHAARAAQLGATVPVTKVSVATLWPQLPAEAHVTLPADCAWAQPSEGPGPLLPVTASVTCTRTVSAPVVGDETYTTQVEVPVERTHTVKGGSSSYTQDRTCTRENCIKMGNAGNTCFTERYVCGRDTITSSSPDTTATVTVMEKQDRQQTRRVQRRTLAITITGELIGAGGRVPLAIRRERAEIADLGSGGRTFSDSSLSDLELTGRAEVGAAAAQLVAGVRRGTLAGELTAAASERDPLRAEEHALRAVLLGDPGARLVAAYQLTSSVQALLDGAALVLPAVAVAAASTPAAPSVIAGGYPLSRYPSRPTVQLDVPPPTPLTERLGRLVRRTEVVIEQTDRDGPPPPLSVGKTNSTMTGVRIERGWNLSDEEFGMGFSPGFTLGGGSDDKLGGYYEARVGVAAGMRGESIQFLAIGAVGVAGLGVFDVGATVERRSELELIYGAELRYGLDAGWSLDGRLWGNTGGPLGAGLYASGQLLRRWPSGTELGVEVSRRDHGDAALMTGIGIMFRTANALFE